MISTSLRVFQDAKRWLFHSKPALLHSMVASCICQAKPAADGKGGAYGPRGVLLVGFTQKDSLAVQNWFHEVEPGFPVSHCNSKLLNAPLGEAMYGNWKPDAPFVNARSSLTSSTDSLTVAAATDHIRPSPNTSAAANDTSGSSSSRSSNSNSESSGSGHPITMSVSQQASAVQQLNSNPESEAESSKHITTSESLRYDGKAVAGEMEESASRGTGLEGNNHTHPQTAVVRSPRAESTSGCTSSTLVAEAGIGGRSRELPSKMQGNSELNCSNSSDRGNSSDGVTSGGSTHEPIIATDSNQADSTAGSGTSNNNRSYDNSTSSSSSSSSSNNEGGSGDASCSSDTSGHSNGSSGTWEPQHFCVHPYQELLPMPRMAILSGLPEMEWVGLCELWDTTGLPQPIFASVVPPMLHANLGGLVDRIANTYAKHDQAMLGPQPPSLINMPKNLSTHKGLRGRAHPSDSLIRPPDSPRNPSGRRTGVRQTGSDESSFSSEYISVHDPADDVITDGNDLIWIIDPKTGKQKGVTPDQLREQVASAYASRQRRGGMKVPPQPPPQRVQPDDKEVDPFDQKLLSLRRRAGKLVRKDRRAAEAVGDTPQPRGFG